MTMDEGEYGFEAKASVPEMVVEDERVSSGEKFDYKAALFFAVRNYAAADLVSCQVPSLASLESLEASVIVIDNVLCPFASKECEAVCDREIEFRDKIRGKFIGITNYDRPFRNSCRRQFRALMMQLKKAGFLSDALVSVEVN